MMEANIIRINIQFLKMKGVLLIVIRLYCYFDK
jgi:hypothetical protein